MQVDTVEEGGFPHAANTPTRQHRRGRRALREQMTPQRSTEEGFFFFLL